MVAQWVPERYSTSQHREDRPGAVYHRLVASRQSIPAFAGLLACLLVAFAASGQDAVKAYPKNYSVAFDNQALEVIRVHYGPHESVGVHDHSDHPTVYVYLNDAGPVRFSHFEEKQFSLTRPPTHTGAFRISPGRIERHTVENLSDRPSDFLRVELKQVPIRSFQDAERGEAPAPPLKSMNAVEAGNSAVTIRRIICADTSSCAVESDKCGSLLIAFSPVMLKDAASSEKIVSGDVRWLAPGRFSLSPESPQTPAHLLEITPRCMHASE